jgi:aminoglycoside phosphotransferase (APT) family kinase protein|tara:strand:+ start:10965 stop:11924 length:960 start_codon:yes stop_codon:yes gene_type:complete
MNKLKSFLEDSLKINIKKLVPLSGGASAEINKIILDSGIEYILRRSAFKSNSPLAISKSVESNIQREVLKLGAPVPKIIFDFNEKNEIGEGYVMQYISGETIPRKILRDKNFDSCRNKLLFQIGSALAKIHSTPINNLTDVKKISFHDSLDNLYKIYLSFDKSQPVFDLAFKYLKKIEIESFDNVLVHGDFRLGNFIISEKGLESIIDWELAHIGNPIEDLAWLCVKSWRFGNINQRAGGLGSVENLLNGYNSVSDLVINNFQLNLWQMFGTLKWGIICMVQTFAHLSGDIKSIEKAAIGRRVSETELDLMEMMKNNTF